MSEPTHIRHVLAALGFLDADAQITITVRVTDLRAALEAKAGGPQVVTAEQAALYVGRTPEYWRRAAKRGDVVGAWQDSRQGPWRLPREACEAHLRAKQRRPGATAASVIPFDGGRARGPRKAKIRPSAA